MYKSLQIFLFFLLVAQICFAQQGWMEQSNHSFGNHPPNWVQYFGNYDYPVNTSYNFVTFDKAGDIYAIGSTQEAFPRVDVSIRSHYDSEGNLLSLVEDKGFLIDRITFDSLGNVYEQGYDSIGYFIAKLDPQWNEQWKLYEYCEMIVDSAGNVFVFKNPGLAELITYKFNSDGILQWEKHFTWPGYSMYYTQKLAADGNGGVVAIGYSYNWGSYGNPTLIKYAADGNEEWRARYNGAELHYSANGLAIDDSGSVYISVPNGDIPNITAHTVKYNNYGIQQWVVTNSGFPQKLILDDYGNVYLALQSNGFTTVKYNNNGVQQWSKQLSPPPQTDYYPQDISLDVNNNIYVVGYSASNDQARSTAVKYNHQGEEQWVFTSQDTLSYADLPGCAISYRGEICVVGRDLQSDGTIFKINSSGNQEWLDKCEGVKYPDDYAVDMGVDSLQNIYICGTRSVFRGSSKGLTILKYDKTGNQQWSIIDDSTLFVTLPKMKVFSDGTVVVAYNYFTDDGINYQYFFGLKCFDSIGNLQWDYKYQSPFHESLTRGYDILIPQSGYLYLVFLQYTTGSPTWDCNTIVKKFSKSGNQLWSTEIIGLLPGGNSFTTIDKDNQIFLFTRSTYSSTQNNYLIKLDENGQQVWQKSIDYPGFSNSVIVDGSDFIYIAGSSNDSYYSDILIKKFDAEVNGLWNFRHDGNAHFSDYASAIQLDNNGNLFASGSCADTVGGPQTFVAISLDKNGNQRWIKKEYGTNNGGYLALDKDENVYFAASNEGLVTYKFSNEGNLIWKDIFNHPSNKWVNEIPSKIMLNGIDQLVVTGTSNNMVGEEHRSHLSSIITTLQYDLTTTSIDNSLLSQPEQFALFQNYPNPFNPSTKISWQSPVSSWQTLKVYDVLGREVKIIVNEEKEAGYHSIDFNAIELPSGVYFYHLRAGAFVDTRKMILLR